MQVYFRNQLVGELRRPIDPTRSNVYQWFEDEDPGEIWAIYDLSSAVTSVRSYEAPIRMRRVRISGFELTVNPGCLEAVRLENSIPSEGVTSIRDQNRDQLILEWPCLDLGTDAATYEKMFDLSDFEPV